MAKKTLGYIELEWTCPSCYKRNPGSAKACQACGAAMPGDAKFELPAQQTLDTSAETAAQAQAGPDIACPYCEARNPATAKVCSQCGGDLTQGARREQGGVVGAFQSGPAPEIKCPNCGSPNPAAATQCSQCGAPLGRPEEAAPAPAAPAQAKRFPIIPVILVSLLACIIGGVLLTRPTSQTAATVGDVEWVYTVQIEALAPVQRQGWRDEAPAGAQVQRCEKKVRYTVSDPQPGATEVCGTPYVLDTGTGKGQVVQDCEYQVPDDYCTYTVDVWQPVAQQEAHGHDFSPSWPEVNLALGQREGARSESYQVTLEGDGQNYTYEPSSLEEFRRFELGSRWVVRTNALGGVMDIEPAD